MPAIPGSRSPKSATTASWPATRRADPGLTIPQKGPGARSGAFPFIHSGILDSSLISPRWARCSAPEIHLLVQVTHDPAAAETTNEVVRLCCHAGNPVQRDCEHCSGKYGFFHQ